APLHPAANSASGYGSKLLDLTIKSQLRGAYSREWTAQGLAIEIVLPEALFNTVPQDAGGAGDRQGAGLT
ncbi:MAG TPA: hypothetical protein VL133_09940, partial [Devosia sp.]|nr:hypothetical protein [Devosia sp.]